MAACSSNTAAGTACMNVHGACIHCYSSRWKRRLGCGNLDGPGLVSNCNDSSTEFGVVLQFSYRSFAHETKTAFEITDISDTYLP